jgi:hypothetical protein
MNVSGLTLNRMLGARAFFRSVTLKKLVPTTDPNTHLPTETEKGAFDKKMLLAQRIERGALALGILSQIATFCAYLYLYQFAKRSISGH